MNLKQKYGNTALIAGGSEGIGAAFAERLAAEGLDLILIARRIQPLNELASSLETRYKIRVRCISCDLSDADAGKQVEEAVRGEEISLMVYNAAMSYIGPFINNSQEHHLQMARANMLTPMTMLHIFGEKMVARGKGAIVLMTSMAGLQGSGNLSVYAATKAFARILGEGLWYEWKSRGVDVMSCCAGATSTPGYINSRPGKSGILAPRVLAPEEVADECLSKLGKKPFYITGRGNRIAYFIMQHIIPRKTAIKIMGDTTAKMYRL